MTTPALAVEMITLPVRHVHRALRFYLDQVGFAFDVDYAPTYAFRVAQLTAELKRERSRTGCRAGHPCSPTGPRMSGLVLAFRFRRRSRVALARDSRSRASPSTG
jgi:hypothetical protein